MIPRLSLIRVTLAGLALSAGAALLVALVATMRIEAAADSPSLPPSPPPDSTSPTGANRAPRYGMPIAGANPAVSSTFGEYRPGHFHAGVDFSTGGRVGIPVLAIDDGHVVRVRASGLGYGRAIYVQLRDGRLAVYAHLSSYMPELARYVESVQDSLGRYRVDLWPAAGRFPVKRGQTIGNSGRSGAGGPHFHFEMREGDIALNPMSHGFVLDDARAPLLHALYFTPLVSTARVNGWSRKLRVPLVQGTGSVLTARETIELHGPVAVSLQAHDPGQDPENRLGIYRLELWVDDASDLRSAVRPHRLPAQPRGRGPVRLRGGAPRPALGTEPVRPLGSHRRLLRPVPRRRRDPLRGRSWGRRADHRGSGLRVEALPGRRMRCASWPRTPPASGARRRFRSGFRRRASRLRFLRGWLQARRPPGPRPMRRRGSSCAPTAASRTRSSISARSLPPRRWWTVGAVAG